MKKLLYWTIIFYLATQTCCKMNQHSIKQNIIEKLKTQNEHYARLLGNDDTELSEVDNTFLDKYKIYKAEYSSPSKPVIFYIGFEKHHDAIDLTGQPKQFIEMARREGVLINSVDKAVNYVKVFFEITRDASSLTYIIDSTHDIMFKPNLSDDEQAQKTRFLNEFNPIIHPLLAQKTDDGSYIVNYFAIANQQLEQHTAHLQKDGYITIEKKVVVANIPTVYGL